ncbi:MAG TPA: HlyD family efflux transporter periplasmic adaptor subunit [Blastocatellia bacterium]
MAEKQSIVRKIIRLILVLGLVGVVGFLIYRAYIQHRSMPKGVLFVSGRIESDDSAVAAKVAGRIKEITVREGDQVKAGQIIAVLDDPQATAREDQARSMSREAQARLEHATQQIGVLSKQLDQSKLMVDQSKLDAQGRVKQAEAQLASAEASLAQAEANLEQARYDASKFGTLADAGAESERTAVQAKTTADAQDAAVKAARKQVDAYRGALEAAQANLANPAIRTAQTDALLQQIHQAQSDIEGAKADKAHSDQQISEAEENKNDLSVIAPFDATVATRSAEPGEVVAAGTPIVTLVNYNQVYLRGYIPEGEIGNVRVGQPARVFLDSHPDQPWEAYVSRVDPEASFTPENTYFENDRVKQVVGLKLMMKDPQGFAKPGMPADGEILVEGDVWPRAGK